MFEYYRIGSVGLYRFGALIVMIEVGGEIRTCRAAGEESAKRYCEQFMRICEGD